jgi:hypothetical protein
VLAQHVDELEPDWVTQSLRDLRETQRVLALNVRIDDGVTAGFARRALRLRGQLDIDGHQSTYID